MPLTDLSNVDWEDPCTRYTALRTAYMSLLSGRATQSVSYTANGVQRSVTYSNVSMSELRKEMEIARAECEGGFGAGRRFAMTGGARRRQL